MERRKGMVLNTSFPPGVAVTAELCEQISQMVIETLIQIHAIDWHAAGLDELGHPEGFLERQVKGWIERYYRAQTDDIPEVQSLTGWFITQFPLMPSPTLIHNDFQLIIMLLIPNNLHLDES